VYASGGFYQSIVLTNDEARKLLALLGKRFHDLDREETFPK